MPWQIFTWKPSNKPQKTLYQSIELKTRQIYCYAEKSAKNKFVSNLSLADFFAVKKGFI